VTSKTKVAEFVTKAVPIHKLNQDPMNARRHDDVNIAAVKASLERFGQTKAVVVAADGKTIIAGNCTWMAAKQLGWTDVVAVFTSLKDCEAVAYSIADNRTNDLSEFDGVILQQLLEDIPTDLLEYTGFSDSDLVAVMNEVEEVESESSLCLSYRVVVQCDSEEHQEEVVQKIEKEGLKCQKLISS